METPLLVILVSLLSVGALALGLLVGYARGYRRGYQATPSHFADLDILASVGRAILSAQLKLDALCEIVYQQANKIVETSDFQIGLFDDADYVIKVWVRHGERLPERRFSGQANSGLIGYVRRTAQGIRVGDFQREWEQLPAHPSYESVNPPRSALFVPLIAGGECIGVIAVQSHEPDRYSAESLRLMTLLANQAAGAIRNAQLYRQAQERADQLRVISELSRRITTTQALPSLFRQIVTLVHNQFGYYAVNVFTYDARTEIVQLRASSHEEFDRRSLQLRIGEGLVGWCAKHAQTVNVPDVSQDTRYLPVAVLPETRSEFCAPLIVDRRMLGVLDVQSNQLNAFKAESVFMLESLAGQLALAIQEALTYDAERRQAERINAMAEASRAVVSILDINDLLDEVVDLVADYFGYDRVHLFVRIGDRVVFRSGSGAHSARWAIEQLSYSIYDNGFIAWVARTGQPLVSGNVQADERYVIGSGLEDSRSEMTVPIMIGNHVLGVFDIQSPEPDAFTPEDVTLVQALADTVAIGMRNASLFAVEMRRRLLAETLRDVSEALVSSRDVKSVLDELLNSLRKVVDHQAALIALLRPEQGDYIVRAARGEVDARAILDQTFPLDDQMPERLWTLLRQLQLPEDDPIKSAHDRLFAPMQVGGREIGLLALERIGADHFDEEDIKIINAFANQAALAIEVAQLFAAKEEEAWVTSALLSVAEAMSSSLDLSQMLETLVSLTLMLVDVQCCGIMAWDAEFRRLGNGTARGLAPNAVAEFRTLVINDHPLLDLLQKCSAPMTVGSGTGHPLPEDLVRLFGMSALFVMPLVARGTLVGAMFVDPPRRDGDANRRLQILNGIAHQAALALQTARLQAEAQERQRLERELDVAQRIQHSFLPQQLPHLEGWQIATFYRAARQIGGDFYDFIPLKSGKWGIVIADVADKGVPAALFMALCRTNIRAAAFNRDDPVETLLRVNELLLSDSRSDMFVTVWYGVWNPATGEIAYANTGHNPPLLMSADGSSVELTAKGIALGVIENIKLEKKTCVMASGDILVAYTDGITDALRSDGTEFGVIGLHNTVLHHRQRSAVEIEQAIIQALDKFTGNEPPFDDVTLIVIKRTSARESARATLELQMARTGE
ncbi:MAG: GAF domain-containing protein [Anaerolineae bacterium]|nr:GAF domain-containing protein [Anaerolineae bacterium]